VPADNLFASRATIHESEGGRMPAPTPAPPMIEIELFVLAPAA